MSKIKNPAKQGTPRSPARSAVSIALTSAALALPFQAVHGQERAGSGNELEEIVVTGFRESLNTALAEKRNETAAIDAIVAEDIGKFPDSNLAESMQRVPGVTLSRGDGGEGRNISVRGLGPGFTRVRINGMEGASQTGSTDIYGAGNNGRSFDFNAFPSEIFSSLSVRKTPSADVEEGSLGATVDLRAPRPFDFADQTVFTVTTRGAYNTVAEELDPRMSMLGSTTFMDGTFGVLGSFAYQNRHLREVGYSAVDILSASSNGLDIDGANGPALLQPFCTPIGWATVSPSPVAQGDRGATDTMCSTNNPRTSTLEAYNTVYNLRRADQPNVPGSGAFLPRLPRYLNSEQDAERIAATLSLQWSPSDNTVVSLDTLYSKFDVERRDDYLAGLSFGRNVNNNGQPMTSVREIEFDEQGSLVYGLFDGVDVRSESHFDYFETEFEQINLDVDHRFSDMFAMQALVGYSESTFDSPSRLQAFIDIIDATNFEIDFRGGRSSPRISYGVDVSDPSNFEYAPGANGNVTGGFSSYGRPSRNTTKNTTAELNGTLDFTEAVAVKIGAQHRESDFVSWSTTLLDNAIQPLPDGTSIADITRQVTGANDFWGGAPASWTAVDEGKWAQVFGFDSFDYCRVECGASENQIVEEVQSAYLMLTFDANDWLPIPVRGDVGVRYVHTDQTAVGHIPVNAPPGYPYQRIGQRNEVERTYEDWLPSANIVFELTPDLLARVSGSKVMSRPELGALVPNSTVNGITRTGSINNPFLDPIRAKTFDLALEWYFQEGSLLSVAYFYKDIETFIQRRTEQTPFSELGLPASLLDGTAAVPTDIFTVNRLSNTPGGPLEGFELNAQVQLSFMPGFWSNFGVLANYTHVTSEIEYILTSAPDGTILTSTTNDLTGLSRDSASTTLFYETDRFGIRTTGTYRGKYIRGIPASPGSDLQGNKSTIYVDASASYNINDNFNLILEAQNLTDERNVLFIDSAREDTLYETAVGRTYTIGASYKF